MKHTVSAATLAAVVLLAPLTAAGTATADTYYRNCDAAFAAGVSDIPRGESGYRRPLDRDDDGVACEADDPAAGGGGSGDDTSGSSTADQGSGTSSGSGSSSHQVAVVPEGGAETGDGSTEGHGGWWIGGALLAALAGLVTFRRVRSTARG